MDAFFRNVVLAGAALPVLFAGCGPRAADSPTADAAGAADAAAALDASDGLSVEDRNRAVVLRYMEEVVNQKNLDALDEVMAEDWIAHNPGEPNGREGLRQFFAGMFEQFPEIHADVKRVVAQGDLVVVHSHYTASEADRGNDWAPNSSATADFFRLEEGMIVEHWDVVQRPIPEGSVNGNTMFDGGALYNYRN